MSSLCSLKTQFKSIIRAGCHSFGGAACAGAVLLIASSAQAQNPFESDWGGGTIYEFMPEGVQSAFASGLDEASGLAINSAGDLFAGDYSGRIHKDTPGGAQSPFASGLEPRAPAINSAGDLFAGDYSGRIHEDTPGGAQSTLASGLNEPVGPAFQTVPELPALGLLGLGATALLARRRRTGV
jgi:hypothetical protein